MFFKRYPWKATAIQLIPRKDVMMIATIFNGEPMSRSSFLKTYRYGTKNAGRQYIKVIFVVFIGSVPARPAAVNEVGAAGGLMLPKAPKKKTNRWAAMGLTPAFIKAGAAITARMR